MRIIGYVEHPVMKITIFKMDEKRAIKFEAGLLEQTYKFRTFDGFSTLEEIQKWVSDEVIQGVEKIFAQMSEQKSIALKNFISIEEQDEFEEII
jgi:hypothetical protein